MAVPVTPTEASPSVGGISRTLRAGSTPDRLRLRALLTVVILIGVGATAWLLTERLATNTDEVASSTGEVLIATQQVSASFAEADAAAVSVHLAGIDGNREQRRLYEQAIERATSSLERVARLVGDDERSHSALGDIAAQTTRYSGLIEAARLASVEELVQADSLLSEASALNRDEISPQVQVIAARAQSRFNSQTSSTWYWVALGLLVVALLALLAAQLSLHRRFRRLINVPLALASVVLLLLIVFAARAFVTQQSAFNAAEEEAYDAIVVSEQIQQIAYRHRAASTASVLAGGEVSGELLNFEVALTDGSTSLLNQAAQQADSTREAAAAEEVVVRWKRYVIESERIQAALKRGDVAEAEVITQGPANSAFNGFNTSVEAALLDNREQFLSQLQRASDSLRFLREALVIGALLAAVLTWWGFAQRIGEYR